MGVNGSELPGRRSTATNRNDDYREPETYSASGYRGYRERQKGLNSRRQMISGGEEGTGGDVLKDTDDRDRTRRRESRGGNLLRGRRWGSRNRKPMRGSDNKRERGRYTEVTRILGHQWASPFGAFGILAWGHEEYLGNREGRRRIGVRSADTSSKCIYARDQRWNSHYVWKP